MRNSLASPKKKDPLLDDSKGNDDLINYLEQKLEEIEKKLAGTQNEYEALQSDYGELQEKMN
jgi:chaperonin cofactor prefoldin